MGFFRRNCSRLSTRNTLTDGGGVWTEGFALDGISLEESGLTSSQSSNVSKRKDFSVAL
jgi:hypothetical protein